MISLQVPYSPLLWVDVSADDAALMETINTLAEVSEAAFDKQTEFEELKAVAQECRPSIDVPLTLLMLTEPLQPSIVAYLSVFPASGAHEIIPLAQQAIGLESPERLEEFEFETGDAGCRFMDFAPLSTLDDDFDPTVNGEDPYITSVCYHRLVTVGTDQYLVQIVSHSMRVEAAAVLDQQFQEILGGLTLAA
ncbi:MAG: hypothetical protein LBR20_07480 [Propionibacteriaceae bacterium]|jgi:hypothetical protein|nr:hypothetical protein [Propionibacteriaceae bacterium]